MSLSAFSDRAQQPSDADLGVALGRSAAAWTRLIALVAERIPSIEQEWGFTSPKTGWGLRLRNKGRVILYMTPGHRAFLASLALGERAVVAAREAGLPSAILEAIESAPRYAEGRGVRVEVRNSRLVPGLAALAAIKQSF
jgi:hypothetical protein